MFTGIGIRLLDGDHGHGMRVGATLIAPRFKDAGREEWSYEDVGHVKPGGTGKNHSVQH